MLPNFDNDIQNPLIDSLRKKIEDTYGVDTSEISNEQLLFKHGQDLQKNGYTMSKMRSEYGDEFTDQYFDIKNRPSSGRGYLDEISSGFKEQGYGLLGMPFQAAGLVSGAVGDAVGVDLGVEDYLMQKGSEIAQKGQQDPRTIQSIDDVRFDNPSEIARFLLGGVGAATPSVLESAAVFTGAGGVGYTIAKSRAKKALAETIKNKGVKTGDQAVKDVFQELVKQRARQGFNTGSQVGLGVSSIGLGVGEIYGELYQYTQLDPSDPDYVSPATARALSASFGTLAGSLDMLSAGKLLSRMTGATTEKSASYLKRLLQALPEGIVLEGGTEVAQEFLNMAAEKYAKGEELEFTDQEIVRMIDAGILGAIGGTGFSTIGAIPGPKKPQDPEVGSEEIASETKEVRAQRELLDTMKEESTDTLRYQVGDKVQTAYGQKGVVKEVRAEESVVEMADGTVREIRNDRLAEALEPPVVEPPKVDPDKAKQDVAKPTEVVPEPAIPKHEEPSAEEQFVELEGLNGNAVKVTPQTKKDIATLLKYYRKWQKEDMYTFKGRSKLSGKGWDSSDFTRMEIKLGPDRALIRGKRGITNKAALVELGYLDNNGNWHKETPADRAFVKEEFQKLKDARLKVIADNDYIAVGKKVKTAGRILGEIESITKDGHVVVDGEEYDPKRLYRVKEPKPKKVKDPQSPSNPNSTPALNFLGTEEDVADKEITYFYYMANGRLSQTTKKLGKHKDRSSIKTALIDMFVKELPKGKSAVGNAAKIRIGEEEFLAAYDEDGFDFGSIKITKTEIEQAQINKKGKEEKDNGKKGVPQKTSLSEPIFTKVADEDNPDTVFDENGEDPLEMFTDLVEEDDIIGESGLVGGDFSRNISQITKSKALLILKKGDKLRIVSVGHPNAKNKIPYVYDGTRQGASRSRYIELSTMLKDWSVTGKLVSNKAVPFTDVLYPDSDAFNNDQILKNAVEAIDSQVSEDKADLELTHEIQKANKEEAQLDDTIAAIQQQLKELKGESDPNIQASAIDDDDKAAKIAQLEAQLEVLLKQKEQLARERKTAIAKKKVRMDKGEAQGRGAVREGVDGTEEGGEGFTTSTTMAGNVSRGDVSKIWVKYLHKLTPKQFEHVLDTSNTVAPAGSKRGKNAKKIFESVGRSSNAKEFFSLVRDMVGGTETGKKDLIASYNENPTLFDNYLTKLYQRLINDNATKAYKKDGKVVADPMDTDKRDVLRDMLVRYFKQRGDTIMKTVDLMSYEQARRGDETDVTLQESPVPQAPEPTPTPVEEEAPPSQRDIRVEKFKQLKDTLKAYELPVDVGLFAGLMKVDLGPAINKEPNEVYEAALDEILYHLNIESELESADRDSFMEFFKNRTSIEDIAVMFDQGGSKIGVAEEQNQGDALFLDGYELDHVNVDEGRLNPNRSRVPIIDPTTGRREITQTGTTSLEAIDHSYSEARRDPRRYIAQVENPVAKHPGRVEEAQAAMRRFAPLDGPFSAQSAIRQIIDQFPHLGYITNVARMLSDNKFLNGYTIELVPWERYRPYARVNGTLTRAVHIRNQKKILVSDAFWGINETLKSDEALAAVILHELLHPALNPVLDVVLELQGSGAVTSEVDAQTKELATSLHSSMEKLMPYLREQSAGDSKLRYGLTSVDEFFSVFASDPYFRDFLSRTPLPESMRRGGVLQTVLDFIYRILAKLNFATAKTDSALDYATQQMAELIEKSNSMSHALDARGNKIQASNTEIQASAIDTEFNEGLRSEGPYFYREVLNDISERSKQGSTEYNIIQAINILRGGKGDGSEAIRSASSSTSEIDPETKEQVKDFARASVELIDEAQINEELDWGQKFSGEHDVYFDEGRQEYIKAYRGSTPLAEYLERLLLHNHYFPEVRLQLDGFVEREASDSGRRMLMPVISQKALKEDSKAPTPLGVINTEMLKKGFRNQGITGLSTGEPYNTYIRGSVRVRDLTSRNAIIQDGVPYLFDPYIDKGVEQSIEGMEIEIGIIERILEGNVRYDRDPQATKYMERFNLSNNEDALNQLESLVQEMEYVQSQDIQASAIDGEYIDRFQDDFDPSISANPDENMKVMMESNAASFNELVTELVKVYQQIGGEKLGIDLETFIDKYGSPGSTNLSTIKKRLEKDLSPFMDSIDDIRIDNAGLNRVAFNWGRRKGVANLESVRTKARKELQNRILAEEMAEKAIIESKRTYEDLENGRFPPIAKQVENILGKATTFNFETLRDYVTSLPNAEITQADVRAAQDLTKKEIERVMELLVELPGEAETMKKGELMDALKTLGVDSISGDTKTHAVKRMAIMRAIRESKGQMALYRLSKGKIGADQQTMLNLGRRIAAAKDLDTLGKIAIMSDVKGTPFRHFAKLKEAEITERNALEKIKQDQEIYSKIDLGLKVRSDVLRASLGELQPVSIHDGASILTMEWDDKEAQWKRGENFQVKIKNGKIVDRAQFVKVNRETLRFVNDPDAKKEFGEEPWFDLMREQALLAMAEPIGEEYFHVQRATWMSGLQGLTERFSKLGYEGMKLAQMSSQTVALFRDYSSKSQALSLQFNASAQRLMSALKIGGREFYAGIYQDIWWWFDNHPEFANNEEQAFSELWKYLRKAANIPDRTLLDDNARRLTKDMVAKTLAARDFEKSVNKQLGNRIKDDEFKVQSYIDGELVDFYRDPIDIGYATMPRSINDGMVLDTNKMMQKAGWRGEAANELIKEAQSLIDQGDLETMQKIYKSMFTDEVVERFLKPFLHSDVRQSVFRGPTDADGHNPFIGNTFIREAFRVSGGDIYAMTDLIFDKLSIDTTQQERTKWKYYFLKQVDNKYLQLKNVADRLETERVEQGLHDSHLMRNTPQSLDSRMMESRLPKEFFYYTMYDEVTSSIRLALQVATKTFGRQGDNAQKAFTGGRATFEEARAEFNVLMSKATNGSHKEPWKHYSREVKKEAYRLLRLDGHSNPEKKWNELYSKSVALGELNRSMEHLARYYGKDNAAGPYKDANLLLELLGVQALSVLNNPKSSFWQNLGLFEFPMAFRGLNKMAGKGTAAALGNFVNQTFGGMAEAMGMEMEKTGRYAQYLNNTHFRLDEMDLDFKTYVGAQLGSGGDLAGHEPRKYLRMVKRAMMFNKRKNVSGTRAPFDFLTVIKGIFPYANNVINHSIGVGAIHAYNDLVIQVAEEIERRGITEYSGEFTAQDLGMGEGVGEWIVGEGDGYRRMNELLVSHGLPTVTRMAFDFIDRKKIDKNAFPIERNAALLINTIAMDQISGDGFNAKPAWLYSNEYLRYFNTFLGWPLGKMGRDLTAVIRDSDDPTTTYIALIKYIGLLTSVYMPLSLSFGMMIDWYDEEMLEKPNNLPPITPWAALPLVGLPIAMSDPNFTIYSVTSRLAKAGVPFGMGTELLNGIFSKGDPYGASRELSLDSRIFMFSMFKNIYDAMGTWIHQGEFDWETVGRPIAYGVGGNSVIQMVDLATAKMDIDSEERRVADYIGLKNTIKKTAFMMGLELRPPFKGGGRPTPLSVNTRQMARAAYAGDSQGFLEQYQEALQAARDAGKENPEQAVIDSYKTRSLRIGITRTRMTDEEWNMLMSVLDENDRRRVMQAVSAHEHYLRLIGGQRRAPSIRRTLDANEARMRAAALLFS